jgi:hypothetical protein
MTTIRRPWPPALRWAARDRKPVFIHLRTRAERARTRVYRMLRQPGAVTWELVREDLPKEEEKSAKEK